MKTTAKNAIREEGGKILILVLVLLVVGGLLLTPLLGLMSTGLASGQVYEKKASELYAADAGVEDAIWRITNNTAEFGSDGWYVYPAPLVVNEKTVGVRVFRQDLDPTCREELRYWIISTGEAGSATTIDAYLAVYYMDFSSLLDYAIVSQNSVGVWPNARVEGDVWLPEKSPDNPDNKGTITGKVWDQDDVQLTWPDDEQLVAYYYAQVDDLTPSTSKVYTVPAVTSATDWHLVPQLLSEPEKGTLTVTGDGWIRLSGIIFVRGNLVINPTPLITLDLAGQTIFVEGSVDIGPKVTLRGSGCIIATGDVTFQPNCSSANDEFILVMSTGGKTTAQPRGTFVGCVAGQTHVQLQPDQQGQGKPSEDVENYTVRWIDPEGKMLNFPMGVTDIDNLPPATGLRILSWQIEQGGQ